MSRQQPTTGGGDGAASHQAAGSGTGRGRLVPDGGDAVFDDLDEGGEMDDFDDFDDLDDEGEDALDDGAATGGGDEDLEPRVKELEAQLDSISNSVETARIDTEDLAESIDHIQDNIRQLLDIYEIVAKSANPFVDGTEGGLQLGDAAFDLFGDLEEDFPEHEEDPAEEEEDEDGDGQTFDDLKAQYDEEDEDPAEEDDIEDPFDDTADTDAEPDDTEPEEDPGPDEEEADPEVDEAEDEDTDVAIDLEDDDTPDPFDDDEWDLDDLDEPDSDAEDSSVTDGIDDGAPGKPYLSDLPAGYSTDVVVMEWLGFLVTAGDERAAIHAIQYYADLDWISDEVADDLGDRVRRADFAPRGSSVTRTLGTADHTRSLAYITHLGGSPDAAVAGIGGGR